MLGYSYWQKRFAGNPNVIGRQIRLNGKSATIIGVAPKKFTGTYAILNMDGYLPFSSGTVLEQGIGSPADRNARTTSVLARLKPGVSFSRRKHPST